MLILYDVLESLDVSFSDSVKLVAGRLQLVAGRLQLVTVLDKSSYLLKHMEKSWVVSDSSMQRRSYEHRLVTTATSRICLLQVPISVNTKENIFFQNIKNYQNQRVGTILHCTLTFTTATSCNLSATSFTGTRIESQNTQTFQNI